MNVLVISGSRNPNGQTAQAANALIQGITDSGNQADQVFIPQVNIERCRQCEDNGWGACVKEGRCVIEDDFSMIVEKVRSADAIVFTTPVYFGDLSESLRAFLDRLRRVCRIEAGQTGISDKPVIGICVAGGSGGGAPSCVASLEKTLIHCNFDVVDMIPVKRQNLDMKMEVLRSIGKWLISCCSAINQTNRTSLL